LKGFGNSKKSIKNGDKAYYSIYQRKEMFLNVETGAELHYLLCSVKYSLE
jgi:hypothetical protein